MIEEILPDSGGHSPLERSFLKHVARVDFLFEDHRLVVEVTGRLGHVSDAERTRDAQRRNELQDLGFAVIEYTSTQVWKQRLWVLSDLTRRLNST